MFRKRIYMFIFLVLAITVNSIGCSSNVSDLKIENVSCFFQSGGENINTQEDSFFELLNYHKQCLYLENGYTFTKWIFESGEYTCKQSIPLSMLFPQEYENVNNTIEFIKNYEINMVSSDGRFISIFNARDPIVFYIWDVESDVLSKINSPSPIRKMQWADNESLLYLLTKDNNIYSFDLIEKHDSVIPLQTNIPAIGSQQIGLLKNGALYFDGTSVLFAGGDPETQTIINDVSEFFGLYQNTIVVRRMNGLIEAGFIGKVWKPFYSERVDYCYPVNGQYLRLHKTDNHNEVWLIDLMTGSQFSFNTSGYGYDFFPKTDTILFLDEYGAPCIQSPGNKAEPLQQLSVAEPYINKTATITQLTHEVDGGISLILYSMEDYRWSIFKINTKGEGK